MKKLYYWVFLALLVAYLALSIFLPPDPSTLEKFSITSTQAKMLSMTVVIPISFIYLLALYGTVWFKSFAESVRKTKEGPAYGQMADGLMILALSLPLHSVFSSLNNYVANYYPHWIEEMVIARNYVRVILTVIAFTFIARGAERLVRTVRTKITFDRPLLSLFGTITLTTLYVWLIITRHHVEAVSPVLPFPAAIFWRQGSDVHRTRHDTARARDLAATPRGASPAPRPFPPSLHHPAAPTTPGVACTR